MPDIGYNYGSLADVNEELEVARENMAATPSDDMRRAYAAEIADLELVRSAIIAQARRAGYPG